MSEFDILTDGPDGEPSPMVVRNPMHGPRRELSADETARLEAEAARPRKATCCCGPFDPCPFGRADCDLRVVATSDYLNRPLRTIEQATADIANERCAR